MTPKASKTTDAIATKTVPRAVTMAVTEPLSGSWKELRDALAEMWAMTTQASNWMVRECYARDIRRENQAKMPPMPFLYLYPETRKLFPDLPPQSVASLEHAVKRKYRALRYQIVWTCAVSLPTFRYPTPFPVHNQSWDLWLDPGGRPVVNPRIGDKRWEMRLRGGARYRRQLTAFKQMVGGAVKRGELAVYRNTDGEILVKMVGHFPVQDPKAASSVLRVRTAKDKLLIAVDDKDERIWNLNFDHLKRWIAEYAETLERLRQDRKAEQRPTPSFEERQTAMVEKQRRRMHSAVQEAVAHVVNFAVRRKFSGIRFDDKETGFALKFPWFQLRDRLQTKCADVGLVFEHAPSQDAGVKREDDNPEGEAKE